LESGPAVDDQQEEDVERSAVAPERQHVVSISSCDPVHKSKQQLVRTGGKDNVDAMARMYAATGDAVARLDQDGGIWRVELSLRGTGAQCLAVDPADADTVFAGLREGGVQKTTDGG